MRFSKSSAHDVRPGRNSSPRTTGHPAAIGGRGAKSARDSSGRAEHCWPRHKGVKSGVPTKQSNIGSGARIKLIHRRQSENLLDGAQHTGRVVVRADRGPASRPGADALGRRAVTAHVIPTRLWIIFNAENGHLRPELGMAECLHNPSQRQIVVGHACGRVSDTGPVPLA